ncbi:MAG: hypothetical protein HOO88_07700 [Kiritimatiellaceae bacterium]|nr:hypothetical protein [Kiritimatiellaceae bacterium]
MKISQWIITVSVATVCVAAQAAPVEWGGHYYELIGSNGTWDQAKTAAESLSYSGYIGHLATLNSEAEFNFVKSMSALGAWNISWVGAHKVGSDYVWVNGEGTVDFSGWSTSPWASGQPDGNVGVAITGSGYGSNLRTQSGTCGEYMVEYGAAIPEPASALMIGLGGLLIAGYRRFFGRV